MTIKAVFFDIDGTLVDSNDFHVSAWEVAFATVGVKFDRRMIRDQIGKGTDALVPTLLPNAEDSEIERLGDAHGTEFKDKYLKSVKPFSGAHDLLERVHGAGLSIVFASSAGGTELDHYLDLLDARDLVVASTSADDVEHTKPAPDIFAVALSKVDLSPAEVIVVGDTPYDVEAAGKCGIAAIAVRSGGFSDEVLRAAGAVEIYDDVAALLAQYNTSRISRSQ
jgi:HAD superfamily hydrolase (TIGR01509 family)